MSYIEKNRIRLDPFILEAKELGYQTIDDFPRLASEADALEAIEIIINGKNQRTSDFAITLLLGQWRSNPSISEYIRSYIRNGKIISRVLSTRNDSRIDRSLIPHLHSHLKDFLHICPLATSHTEYCEKWNGLAARSIDLDSQ
jgi:hypothetical protein